MGKTSRDDTKQAAAPKVKVAKQGPVARVDAHETTTSEVKFVKQEFLGPAGRHEEYVAKHSIVADFNQNCLPITVASLVQKEKGEDQWMLGAGKVDSKKDGDPPSSDDDIGPPTKILYVMLLSVTKPPKIVEIQPYRNKGKKVQPAGSYKNKLTFASLNDSSCMTVTILERSTNENQHLWHWNKGMKGVRPGERFVIQNPRAVGNLQTKSVVVETKLPLIQVIAPVVKPMPVLSQQTDHTQRFFICKNEQIKLDDDHLPVPWKTSCNNEHCDRLGFGHQQTVICGCWGALSKNDTSNRNVVLNFDFGWNHNGLDIKVQHFTSLRTTKLLFKNEHVCANFDTLSYPPNQRLIQRKALATVKHVNKNGGWTVVGWYLRGEKETEDRQENEARVLSEDVKYNVSYLYPTVAKHASIPDKCLFASEDVFYLREESAGNEDQHNV